MKLDKLNQWITLSANLGVLVGIIFLSLEISLSNRIAIGTAEYEILRDINATNQLVLTNESVRAVIAKLGDPHVKLNDSETQQAIAYAYNFFSVLTAAQAAHDQGLVSDEYLETLLVDVRPMILRTPGLKFAWDLILSRGYEPSLVLEAIASAVTEVEQQQNL